MAQFVQWTPCQVTCCSVRCEMEMISVRDEESSVCPMDSMYGNMLFCHG